MARIRCVVERITYQSQETGYSVLKTRVKGYSELVPVVGNLLDVSVGSVLNVDGSWKVDPKYGRQFQAERWEETVPATAYGIEKYLGSGLIKGVGPKFARRIVDRFGADTLKILDEEPERLNEVEGIGARRVQQICESWARQKEIKNVMLFLQSHDVSTAFAARIYRTYGDKSIETVKANPYRLADDVWGIGFKTADTIAAKLGYEADGYARVRSGIFYTLNTLGNEGHVFADRPQLAAKAVEMLGVEDNIVDMTLDQMIEQRDVMVEDEAIYLPAFYYAELGVAGKLLRLAAAEGRQSETAGQDSADIARLEEQTGIRYDEVQAEAIRQALVSKVMVLTGGPGTGKTTTVQGIIAALRSYGRQILLAAPTGRAARRLSEATGMEAKTIHRLLECKPPEGYGRNEENPLEGDVLIVDECSMIDILLMNSLLKALPGQMALILVGDIDQLPSVGPGNVLRDIIDSERFPVIRLTRIFRQAQSSRIILNAHRINRGEFPDCSNGRSTDFYFVTQEDPDKAAAEIVQLVRTNLPRYYKVPSSSIQVLTPMQRGVIGAASLNVALQQAINPPGGVPAEGYGGARAAGGVPAEGYGRAQAGRYGGTAAGGEDASLSRGGYTYRVGDRIMQIRNNYDKDVYNGDIGTVTAVDTRERTLSADFDGRRVEYDISELDELVLAYAVTVHKSQGSEYPIVVMPILMNHYVMLQRNLIYTAITRAKKLLVLIGSKKALAYAVKNVTVTKRNTRLSDRLRGEVTPDHRNEAGQQDLLAASYTAESTAQYTARYGMYIRPVVSASGEQSFAELFERLSRSEFRSRFRLGSREITYMREKGRDTIRQHAEDFVRKRLAPAEIPNDGKQTPMRGHPVFIAQHATACCCRGCLEKWHRIPKGRALTAQEQTYVVDVLMAWIDRQDRW